MRVLLIVDLQRDFCPGGALAVTDGDKIVPLVNRLIRSGCYEKVVATMDWHPSDHCSFASNHPGGVPFNAIELNGRAQMLWPAHCVADTAGAELHPELDVARIDILVKKGTDRSRESYSAVLDSSGGLASDLIARLDQWGEQRGIACRDVAIDVVGLALDYCVAETAIDASQFGYKVQVVIDGTRSVNNDPVHAASVIRRLSEHGVGVIEGREVLSDCRPEVRHQQGRGQSCGLTP